MSAQRRLCPYRFGRWLVQSGVARMARAVLRALFDLVDHVTGETHWRYPMTIRQIAARSGFSERSVQRAVAFLEGLGFAVVERQTPTRLRDGTFTQEANRYRLSLPADCWIELRPVAETVAAREEEPAPARPVERPRATTGTAFRTVLVAAEKALVARGRLSTRDAATNERDTCRNEDSELVGVDGVQVEKLAGEMVLTAKLAAAPCCEARRFVAVAGIERMQLRARELATETTRLGLARDHVLACVRQWVARTLANVAQDVHSAEHAVNILRRFFVAKVTWQDRDAAAAW